MGGTDDHEGSHDPRSWHGGQTPRTADEGAGSASFDPRTWLGSPSAAAAERTAPPVSPLAQVDHAPDGARAGGAAAVGAGIAIMLLGAIVASSARPTSPASVADATGVQPSPRSDPAPAGNSSTIVVPGIEDLRPNLRAAGFARADVDAIVRRTAAALGDQPGEVRVAFQYHSHGDGILLDRLTATRSDGAGIELTRLSDGSLATKRRAARVSRTLRIVRGELDAESFYSSAVAAGISDAIVGDFANAFQFDFDLQREVAPGDVIEAGYEQGYNTAGDEVGPPVLVYASLSTAAKSRALYRFRVPGEAQAEWFDSNGRSTRRALMRTPVEAARISSGFGMRSHPILGYAKLHRGTDFAAPTGTPIYAAGDAVVLFAGPKGANGNFVKLRHDNGWETLYLHMNRIMPGMAAGLRVAQGQQIGEVGTTGRSTGPHLHYEVHIGGEPVNPLSIDTGTGRTLGGNALAAFRAVRNAIDARRATPM